MLLMRIFSFPYWLRFDDDGFKYINLEMYCCYFTAIKIIMLPSHSEHAISNRVTNLSVMTMLYVNNNAE
jgi:hypothetical protein